MKSVVERSKYRLKPWSPAYGVYALGLAILLLALVAVIRFHWHERLWYYLTCQLNAEQRMGQGVWLPGYRVDIDAKPVQGVAGDLSAIAFDADRQSLLAVTNAPPIELLELDREGNVTGRNPLNGFDDVEGLAYLGNGLVAVTEEILQQLVIFSLPSQAGVPIDKQAASTLALPLKSSAHNKGFEGVAYDAGNDRLYLAKERDPRQLYAVSGIKASLAGRLQLKVEDLSDWIERSVFARDISDLYFDPRSGHLLVLSDESKLIIELNERGAVVSFRTLLGHISDLRQSAPQPEGLTLDNDGHLYVVSEPNLFYRFSRH
nr:SdiA-regulated domain-containing protein [uncultured Pseudomonas sp.]